LVQAHLIPKQRIRKEWPRGAFRTPWAGDYPGGEPGPWQPVGRDVTLAELRRRGLECVSLQHLVWDPRCLVLLCGGPTGIGGHHGALDYARTLRIPRVVLPPEVEEYAAEFGLVWSLDHDYGPLP
jgi:hypothetical protein